MQEMRGHPLGGPEKRLRIDFADLDVVPGARRDYEHIDSKHTVSRIYTLGVLSSLKIIGALILKNVNHL